jgi:hypothetical protein
MTALRHRDKTVYMACRNQPSAEAWRRRWRQHASLAVGRPFWAFITHYSQCDVIHEPPFGTGEAYDGIATCRQAPGMVSGIEGIMSDPEGAQMMLEDEQETFGAYVGDFTAILSETVLREGRGSCKLFLRLYRKGAGFVVGIRALGQALLADSALSPLIRGLSAGPVKPGAYTANSTLDFDGLIEISVASLDEARMLLAAPSLRTATAPLTDQVEADWRILVTKENLFWDCETGVDERERLLRDYPPVTKPLASWRDC